MLHERTQDRRFQNFDGISGAGALNQWVERYHDAQMRRTLRRPIAAGRAFLFGTALSCAGLPYLGIAVTSAASLLAALTIGWYLFLYTPLKRVTPLCTPVGAFSGAMPVLIGYVAAAGRLDRPAWLLYGILFLWQFPHFMSIAWMYREDYELAGYRILPQGGFRDSFIAWLTILPLAALLPLSPSAFPLRSDSCITVCGSASAGRDPPRGAYCSCRSSICPCCSCGLAFHDEI